MYFITQSFDNLIRVKLNFTSQHFSIEFHALFTVETLFKLLIQKNEKPPRNRRGVVVFRKGGGARAVVSSAPLSIQSLKPCFTRLWPQQKKAQNRERERKKESENF